MNQIKGLGLGAPLRADGVVAIADPARYAGAAQKTFEAMKLALTKSDFNGFKALFHAELAAAPETQAIIQGMFDAAPKGGQAQLMTMGALQKGDADNYFAVIGGAAPGTLLVLAPDAGDKLAAVFFGIFKL